jgi:hypothetical protein
MSSPTIASVDRTPKPCLHPRARHQHGTALAYDKDDCRCLPCVRAASEAGHRERYRTATGTHTYVDAAAARQHVDRLLEVLTVGQIEQRSGVNRTAIRVLVGDFPGRPATKRITHTTEARLLAVTPDRVGPEQSGIVDGTGTRRRFRALIALGWPAKHLGDRLGFSSRTNWHLTSPEIAVTYPVLVSTRDAVRALYGELSLRTPAPGRNSTLARGIAVARGWLPPSAWDDDSMDDPAVEPWTGEVADDRDDVDEFAVELVLDGQPMHLAGRELELAALALSDRGLTYAEIAARCRSDADTVRRVLNTARARIARERQRQQAVA